MAQIQGRTNFTVRREQIYFCHGSFFSHQKGLAVPSRQVKKAAAGAIPSLTFTSALWGRDRE
jgi:hypothetical protein